MTQDNVISLLRRWFRYRVESEKRGGVLVVAPADESRDGLSAALRAHDLGVSIVSNASDAIETLETQGPLAKDEPPDPTSGVTEDSGFPKDTPQPTVNGVDVVLIANDLEDLEGLDLARFIRSRPYHPGILIYEAEGSAVTAAAALELEIDDYVYGSNLRPEELASRAKKCWEDTLVRRVRKRMVMDLRGTVLSTVPRGNTRLAKELDERIASSLERLSPMKRVLVAESDPDARRSLEVALKELGLEVETTTGGRTALLLVEDDPPNLVVVDPAQSEFDETTFLEKAKQASPGVEVVILSQNPSLALTREAFRLGVADLIPKPMGDPQRVARRVRLQLESRRRDRAEELLILELYGLAREKMAQGGQEEDRSLTEQLFAGIVPQAPPPIPARAPSSSPIKPAQRMQTLELTTGDYEVVDPSSAPPPRTSGVPKKSSTTLELLSGEYEIVSTDESFVTERGRLPDLAVLKYVDRILFDPKLDSLGKKDRGRGRRYLPRVDRSFVVTFQKDDDTRGSLGFLKDLSLGGLFISADPPIEKGSAVHLQLQVPLDDEVHKISCQGTVAWNTLEDDDKLEIFGPGFGVEFTVLDAQGSEILRRVIAAAK